MELEKPTEPVNKQEPVDLIAAILANAFSKNPDPVESIKLSQLSEELAKSEFGAQMVAECQRIVLGSPSGYNTITNSAMLVCQMFALGYVIGNKVRQDLPDIKFEMKGGLVQ